MCEDIFVAIQERTRDSEACVFRFVVGSFKKLKKKKIEE